MYRERERARRNKQPCACSLSLSLLSRHIVGCTPYLENILHLLDPLMLDLADVDEAFHARDHLQERSICDHLLLCRYMFTEVDQKMGTRYAVQISPCDYAAPPLTFFTSDPGYTCPTSGLINISLIKLSAMVTALAWPVMATFPLSSTSMPSTPEVSISFLMFSPPRPISFPECSHGERERKRKNAEI